MAGLRQVFGPFATRVAALEEMIEFAKGHTLDGDKETVSPPHSLSEIIFQGYSLFSPREIVPSAHQIDVSALVAGQSIPAKLDLVTSADQKAIAEHDSWSRIVRGLEILKSGDPDPDSKVLHAVAQSSLYCSPFAEDMGIVGEVGLGPGFTVRPRPDDTREGAVTLVRHFIAGAEKILPESQSVIARTIDLLNTLHEEEGGNDSERYALIVAAKAKRKADLNILAEAFSTALSGFRSELGLQSPAAQAPRFRGPTPN